MGIRLELQCINQSDPTTDDCYSYSKTLLPLSESAEDTQVDVIRAYKVLQKMAANHGWKHAKLAQGAKGWLCPSCAKLYTAQTGLPLS